MRALRERPCIETSHSAINIMVGSRRVRSRTEETEGRKSKAAEEGLDPEVVVDVLGCPRVVACVTMPGMCRDFESLRCCSKQINAEALSMYWRLLEDVLDLGEQDG